MYVADTSPVQSAVRSHVLHFYFPAAAQLILCCLLPLLPRIFLGELAFRMCDQRRVATDGRADWTD